MNKQAKFYVVEESALPEVFLKVAEAKRLLSTGEAITVNDAARRMGISRSAFYKYRDSIFPFRQLMGGRVVTFQLLLQDEVGALFKVLPVFVENKANIQTINSVIPTNGCAVVTISAETIHMTVQVEELLELLRQTPGVVKADILM